MNYLGYLGSLLLAFSGLPQAIKSYREGKTGDISHGLLWMWLSGEVLMFLYALPSLDVPLLLNFGLNTVLVSIITWYRYFPRKPETLPGVDIEVDLDDEVYTLSPTRYMSENNDWYLTKSEPIVLSPEDSAKLVDLLENPRPPTEKLKELLQRKR